jgi:hypothetical protein
VARYQSHGSDIIVWRTKSDNVDVLVSGDKAPVWIAADEAAGTLDGRLEIGLLADRNLLDDGTKNTLMSFIFRPISVTVH